MYLLMRPCNKNIYMNIVIDDLLGYFFEFMLSFLYSLISMKNWKAVLVVFQSVDYECTRYTEFLISLLAKNAVIQYFSKRS